MKTKNYVAGLFMLLAFTGVMNGQNFVYGDHVMPTSYNDIARDVAVINNSLEYKATVGSYQPTSAAGTYNGFVWVTDAGEDLKWYITVEGTTNTNDEVNGVDARARTSGGLSYGDIYFTGYFTGNVTMTLHYGFPIHHFTTTIYTHNAAGGTNDCSYFVTKVNQDGTHQWTQVSELMGQANTEIGNDVDVCLVGAAVEVYTTGFFRGQTSFHPAGASPVTSHISWNSVFTAKYVDNGATSTISWVKTINDNSDNQHDYGYAVIGDGSGNIYTAGSIGGNTTVGGLSMMTVNGNDDAFALKYNSAGTEQWTLDFGGAGTLTTPSDQVRGISYYNGVIYVSGYFNGSTGDFPAWSATAQVGFIAKIVDNTTSGSITRSSTFVSSGNDVCYRNTLSSDHAHCYVVGQVTGDATIKAYNFATVATLDVSGLSAGANADGFIAVFDAADLYTVNDVQWLGADDGNDVTTGVAALSDGDIYVCGTFLGYYCYDITATVYIDNISTNPPTVRDAYIAHYASGLRLAAPPQATTAAYIEADIYPNPTSGKFFIQTKNEAATTVEILDITGRSVRSPQLMNGNQIEIDLSEFSAGVYFAKLVSGEEVELVRVVKE
jgi:hypothetical protein